MSELDLIPASWRARRQARRALVRFAVAYGLLGMMLLAVKLGLGLRMEVEAAELDRLRGDKHSVLTERARLDALELRHNALTRELRTLDRLGGAADLARVFGTIDRALEPSVWFREWTFMRAGEFVDLGPKAVQAGYLILVPEQAAGERKRAWRMNTHMEIRGRALNHSALADFVKRLAGAGIVQEVKILDTRSQHVGGTAVVDFELAVVVREVGSGA